jgi:hypothetical protein
MAIGGGGSDSIIIEDVTSSAILGDSGTITFGSPSVGIDDWQCICFTSLNMITGSTTTDGMDDISSNVHLFSYVPSITNIPITSIMIGGGGADRLSTNASLLSVLIGDYGSVTTVAAIPSLLTNVIDIDSIRATLVNVAVVPSATTDTIQSDDIITIQSALNGRSVVIGGAGSDIINVMNQMNSTGIDTIGDATICGDYCTGITLFITLLTPFDVCLFPTVLFVLSSIASFATSLQVTSQSAGATAIATNNDQIKVSSISNVFGIGGDGSDDTLVKDSTLNVLIGDEGSIVIARYQLTSFSIVTSVNSIASTQLSGVSGNDRLVVSSVSSSAAYASIARSIVLGGHHDDIIATDGTCSLICGDDCSCNIHFIFSLCLFMASTPINNPSLLSFGSK